MSKISYEGRVYEVMDDESVLQCLHRNGVAIPSSCHSGVCQSCLMCAVAGEVPAASQKNLKTSLKEKNYFLACICKPEGDIEVALPGTEALKKYSVTVIDKYKMSERILRLRLKHPGDFKYKAGQFTNLYRSDGLSRSYSIAGALKDNQLELHVEYIPAGNMSSWVHEKLQVGDSLEIDGAHGDCYYSPENKEQNLLLIGTGSGLAPLVGILRDALAQGHRGDISLFHGAAESGRLYMVDELRRLADEHENFFYTPCISGENVPDSYYPGFANAAALKQHENLAGWRIFLCGNPEMVKDTRKKVFLAGASLQEIFSDSFEFSS